MPASKSYFICFTVRSGSTVLCELLARTNIAGKPQEPFYHNVVPDNLQGDIIPDYAAYIEQLKTDTSTANGVFGAKIGGGYWYDFARRVRAIDESSTQPLKQILEQHFPDLRYIWLTRRNKVRQAVSHWMAIQSGRWESYNEISNPNPEYKFESIDYLVQELVIREAVWAEYFTQHQIVPHMIVYEDFVQQKEATIRGIFDFLEIDLPASYTLPDSMHKPTANALSEEWVQRYRAEKQKDWWATFW